MAKTSKKTPKTSTPNTPKEKKFVLPKPVILPMLVTIGVAAAFALALASYTLAYKDQIYPRTYIGNQNFGGKTASQAKKQIEEILVNNSKDILVKVDGNEVGTLGSEEIKLTYDKDKTVESLLRVGRVGSLGQNIVQLFLSTFSRNSVQATYESDTKKTEELLTKIATEIGQLPEDAKIVLNEKDELTVTPSKEGQGVRPTDLASTLRTNLSHLTFETTGTKAPLHPAITVEDTTLALEQTKAVLAKTPLTLTVENNKTTADNDKVFSWINYTLTETDETSSRLRLPIARAQEKKQLIINFDTEKVKSFVKEFGDSVSVEPFNAELRAVNSTITVVKAHRDGKKLKVDETTTLLIAKLQDASLLEPLSLAADVETVQAEVRDNNIEALGIKELLGRAETSYKGSPENRQHNIATGAKFLNGILIPPGKEFSTVKVLGTVDGSTGYLPELVIKDNRTLPEFGGGLCQVSTTLFRSALNAGLKITERSNHSYRVAYYEPPLGLDATIYMPKPDFKFMNDTPGYILVQNKIEGTKISFELYGTKDGRSSSISDTTVVSTTPAGDPVYADTDTLKKGEVKQIEKPHDGATTVVTYTVNRDGQEINKQVFRSRYKAWPARFLVGTKEE